jgi:hypothetical protein
MLQKQKQTLRLANFKPSPKAQLVKGAATPVTPITLDKPIPPDLQELLDRFNKKP